LLDGARPGSDRPDDDARWLEQRTALLQKLDAVGFDPRPLLTISAAERELWTLRRLLAAQELTEC
jgi:hypothetical protein